MPIKIEIDVLDSKEKIKICVDEPYTSPAIASVHYLIHHGYLDPKKMRHAHIYYDTKKGISLDPGLEKYPLRIEGDETILYVNGVTAGYGGEGPHGTETILKMLDFDLTEEQSEKIFTKPKDQLGNHGTMITLDFFK